MLLSTILKTEFVQSLEEGRDPDAINALEREAAGLGGRREALEDLHARLLEVPIRSDFPYHEPDEWKAIRHAVRPAPGHRHGPRPVTNLDDRMFGAWLGRCVGCALGKPVEMFMDPSNGLSSRQRLRRYLEAIDPSEWPLRDYIPENSPAASEAGEILFPDSTREHITFMETDDDIRYTVLGQMVLQSHGDRFSTWDVARLWMNHLGYAKVHSAETQAYRNLVELAEFHENPSLSCPGPEFWRRIATRLNPYREWIGAQIRVDSYGYAAAGHPGLAAEFAHRDARLSHVKNGLYGAMFCAAMIAAAFVEDSPRTIVEAGLAEIPATSRLHAALTATMAICEEFGSDRFEEAFDAIERLLGHYNPVHTINNAAVCAAALLLSQGDFSRGVTLAVMGGWDTDCNGATVGSILGARNGARALPSFWTERLNDTVKAGIVDYHPIPISECARRSAEIARTMAG